MCVVCLGGEFLGLGVPLITSSLGELLPEFSKTLHDFGALDLGVGIGGGFTKAIGAANDEYFTKIGCVAAYAEYGPGQKAMVVLTKAVASSGRVTY